MDIKNPLSKLENGQEYQAVLADLAALRADIAALAAHMTNGSMRAATTAANDMTAEAARLYDGAAAAGKSSAKAVEAQIEAHPLMSLILAFSLGFVGSRLLPR